MSKSVRKSPSWRSAQLTPKAKRALGAEPTSADLVLAIFKQHDPDTFSRLFPAAECELPALVRAGFHTFELTEIVERIMGRVSPGDATCLATVQTFHAEWTRGDHRSVPLATVDAITLAHQLSADAGFALGLVAGLRMAGAR